jgi:hypothetical protein
MTAVDIAAERISQPTEEGFEPFPYDDATRLRVRAPVGNLTWLYGCNLDTEGSQELGQLILGWKLGKLAGQLIGYSWYTAANDARKSVFLDIAFNQGLHGLLGYPSMLHYASVSDWANASAQCTVKSSEPEGVKARYRALAAILSSGVIS